MIRTHLIIAVILALAALSQAADLHLAPGGAADAPGTKGRPLANLEQARDVIRAWKKNGELAPDGVTVWVHGGDYFRQRSFTLNADDSGRMHAPARCRRGVSVGGQIRDDRETK